MTTATPVPTLWVMNSNTSSRLECLKSVPVAELAVTAVMYTFIDQDPTGQDNNGRPFTNCELEIIDAELDKSATFAEFRGRCDCCGSTRLSYACHVVHKPTKQGYYIGRDCAEKLLNMAEGSFKHMSVALAEKAESRRRRNWWLHQNPQHREIVEWAEGSDHYIASDVVRKLKAYGSISERQVELLHKIRAQVAERAAAAAAEPKPTGPAPTGRIEVEVTVLGTKFVENDFGGTTKALVRLAGTNTKAWVTSAGLGRGDVAVIRATFERSRDDEFFAFGSRPKLVRMIKEAQPAK